MIKKTLRNVAVGTVTAGALILPAATTVAPQMQLMGCEYPDSVVTSTKLSAPDTITAGNSYDATVDVNGQGGPNGEVTFKVVGPITQKGDGKVQKSVTKTVTNGAPVTFTFGAGLKDGKKYKLKAKFKGNCRYKNSSDQQTVKTLNG